MSEKVVPGPVQDNACIREAVCIDTRRRSLMRARTRIVSRICVLSHPELPGGAIDRGSEHQSGQGGAALCVH